MTPPALAYAYPAPMIVHSDLLGPITVDADELLEFPQGLYGFPECRSFVLVPSERDGMYWLQSADYTPLAFLLVDPFLFFEEYVVDLPSTEMAELAADPDSNVAILAIVSLPGSRAEKPTANLQGPVAINLTGGRGKQIAISDSDFGVRCPFDLMQPVG